MRDKKTRRAMTGKAAQQSELALGIKIKFLKGLALAMVEEIQELAETHTLNLGEGFNFYEEVRRFEIDLIKCALKFTGGRQVKAARLLGLNPSTLNSKLKYYGIPFKAGLDNSMDDSSMDEEASESKMEAKSDVSASEVASELDTDLYPSSAHVSREGAKYKKAIARG
jgi:DNA-binding protein Fis